MPLSSNPTVWKVLVALFLALTAVVGLCFYFREMFLTLVIGHVLIVITERLIADYRRRVASLKLSTWMLALYGPVTAGFWLGAALFLVQDSITDLGGALQHLAAEKPSIRAAYADKIEPYVPRLVAQTVLPEDLVTRLVESVVALASDFARDLLTVLALGVLLIPLQAVLYFRRREQTLRRLLAITPPRFRALVSRLVREVSGRTTEYLAARIVESTMVGSMCCLGFYLAGVKGWLVFGVLAGALNIVPFIGPVLAAIPPLAITLLLDAPVVAFYVILTIAIAQLVDTYYLEPFMISGRLRLDALLGVVLPLVAFKLFGLMGMILALPIYSIYAIVLRVAYEELVRAVGDGG
jgi:predicted PurR-regulated permease PerM